jgi:hypothetical protein
MSHEPRSYRDDRERNRNAKGSHQSFPGRLHSASEHACSASSAGFIHSSAKTRHVTLRTSSTAACARCRHFSAERRQCAGKFSVSWPALTGPSRRRWLARRNRRLLWPSLALWPGTCGSVRALFRDWTPRIYDSSGGSCPDSRFATCDWPLGPSPDWPRATCGGPLGVFSRSLYGTDPRGVVYRPIRFTADPAKGRLSVWGHT